MKTRLATAAFAAALASAAPALATPEEDRRTVSALDVEYQAAVKRNDAATMGRILDDNFVLILGNGTIIPP